MSLLDVGREMVTIYPQIETTDRDGNIITKADFNHPIQAWVRIQLAAQSGTSARRAEQDNEGFETEETYKLRFARGHEFEPGQQAQLEWRGELWGFVGEPDRYNGSERTRRLEFTIRRS